MLAGRSREKLEALSEELGGAGAAVVPLDDPTGLRQMLEPCSVVIGCAGPFTLHGEPLVAAAADTGTHYLDTTGEQFFIQMAFERYGERAAESGAALVSGMGFDFVPGDLLAALVAEGMGPLEEIVLAYCVHGFVPTHGTALSALEIMAGGDVVWRDGEWQPAPRSAGGGRWRFPEPIGEQRMLRYPAGEQITVPRHVQTARVRTLLNGMVVPPRLMPLAAASTRCWGWRCARRCDGRPRRWCAACPRPRASAAARRRASRSTARRGPGAARAAARCAAATSTVSPPRASPTARCSASCWSPKVQETTLGLCGAQRRLRPRRPPPAADAREPRLGERHFRAVAPLQGGSFSLLPADL